MKKLMPNKKDPVEDILEALKASVDKWSSQGRTPEQIWAVKNYLTGAGRNGIKELLAAKDQEIKQAKQEVVVFMINYYHPGGTPDEVKEAKEKILKELK